MRKIDYITGLYRETLDDITASAENWMSFLHSAAYQYKYPFADQVLIYAQRPQATACAGIELWNQRFGRWVNRGATGIAASIARTYTTILTEGRLNQYLHEIDETAEEQISQSISRMALNLGVTEKMKAENPMQWVQMMNNLKNAAEEDVLANLIYA